VGDVLSGANGTNQTTELAVLRPNDALHDNHGQPTFVLVGTIPTVERDSIRLALPCLLLF
jgi:hypothetical protein